jgi:penicillin-binding protein 1A
MNSVVENGTARRAQIAGIKAAGKTGTTNAYRDAWFVGYTGNYVCGVWFGNDDYGPTNRMTGGSLPAMTWQHIMAYAHQGIEIKSLPGLPPSREHLQPVATGPKDVPQRPPLLTQRGVDVLVQVEHMMDAASRALTASTTRVPLSDAGPSGARDGTLASASDRRQPIGLRGN